MSEDANKSKKVHAAKDGDVLVTGNPQITEKEIYQDRKIIIQQLDAAYLTLIETMQPFQKKWDAGPKMALAEAVWEGAAAGASGWGEDFAEMFEAKTWQNLGNKVKDAAGTAYDTAGVYAISAKNDIKKSVNEAVKNIDTADEKLFNWAWWETQFHEQTKSAEAQFEALKRDAKSTTKTAVKAAQQAKKIYIHRDAILNLPNLIVQGDPVPVENFIDTVLADIDPELAKAIKNDKDFYMVIELIRDHDSILSYLSYATLSFEAVPPNFYAYLAGKGGAYLMIEVILLIITALLTAGAAAVARVTALVARIAASSTRVAGAIKKIEHSKQAFDAFTRFIEDYCNAANRLHELGGKLCQARSKGVRIKGSTKTTIEAKKKTIKRDKKCACCGSTAHTTPRGRIGVIKYV